MAEIKQIVHRVVSQVAAEHNFVNYELQIEPVFSGGANYTSNLFNVTIEEGTNTHHLFVKVAALGDKMRAEVPSFYNTEIFVYTKLAKAYEAIENDCKVPKEHRLILSKFYGYHPTKYEETVVLENLVKKGYQSFDRFESISWEYAASTMIELAKMHALSFAYSETNPEEFNKIIHDLKFQWNSQNKSLSKAYELGTARALETVHKDKRDMLKRFFDKFDIDQFSEFFQTYRKPVLVHGDFRPSNLLHRIREDGNFDIKVVDLQTMQGCSPLVDLLYLIFTGSNGEFRAKYCEKLKDHYYNELHAAMKRLYLDPEKIYSRMDFESEWKEKLPYGLILAVLLLQIVTVAEEDAPLVNEDLDFSSLSIHKPNDRYDKLLNEVVDDYIKWGILQ